MSKEKTKIEIKIEDVLANFEWQNETQEVIYNGKKHAQWTSQRGYKYITIYNKGSKKSFRVHRLIALKYIPNPNPQEFDMVDHIDGNKQNNDINNLRWVNNSINMKSYYNSLPTPQQRIKKAPKIENKKDGTTTATEFLGYSIYNVCYMRCAVSPTIAEVANYMGTNTLKVQDMIKYPTAGDEWFVAPEYITTTTKPQYLIHDKEYNLITTADSIEECSQIVFSEGNAKNYDVSKMIKQYKLHKNNPERYKYNYDYIITQVDKVIDSQLQSKLNNQLIF